jgi:hypothetical protein
MVDDIKESNFTASCSNFGRGFRPIAGSVHESADVDHRNPRHTRIIPRGGEKFALDIATDVKVRS